MEVRVAHCEDEMASPSDSGGVKRQLRVVFKKIYPTELEFVEEKFVRTRAAWIME